MKFSIVIPVYNVEKYIEKCLLSIVEQTYSDYEIIVVDDGSKDKSGQICDEFAKQYDNIKVIHIPNGGVSNARNIGLQNASGEYVWFIDSDDYIAADALSVIDSHVRKHQKLDMLIFDAVVVDENGNESGKITCDLPCDQSLQFKRHKQFVYANTSLWNRIYRMDMIHKKQLRFATNITIAEDLLFNYEYLPECQDVYYEKDALYYYIQRKNSAMSGAGKNRDVQKVFERLILYYKEKELYDTYKDEVEYLAIYHYFIVTSVRMVRCGVPKKECLSVQKWFEDNGIRVSLQNAYVRKMAKRHILVFVLLKLRAYGFITMLFSKF